MVCVLGFALSTAGACDLHFAKSGNNLRVATKTQCIQFDTQAPVTFIGAGIDSYETVTANVSQVGTACNDMLMTLNIIKWHVKWNSNSKYGDGSRPAYDVITGKKVGYIDAFTPCLEAITPLKPKWRKAKFNGVIVRTYCEVNNG